MYEVEFNKQAIKDLKRIPKNYATLIFEKIKILAKDPSNKALNTKKLKGIEGYRLRVGEDRVIYEIENNRLIINIIGRKIWNELEFDCLSNFINIINQELYLY